MTPTLRVWRTLIRGSFLEMVRRKELYVLVILTVLMVVGAYSFTFFGVSGLEIFVKDMAFTAVGLFSTILGVTIATRQIPEEISRRTIYPLLARPISRAQLLTGKFVASWVLTLASFALLLGVSLLVLTLLRLPLKVILIQYIWLKAVSFLWLSAICICLSVYVSSSAAFTLGLLLALGSGAFTRSFLLAYGDGVPILNWLIAILYGFLPHFTLFDIARKVVYGWDPIAWWIPLALTVYGIAISAFWLKLALNRFEKMAL
ncbi:MAG: ABC transporter permease subunit [Capsulimonadales bacterium]|nr:ABC transporter permease subunit [Capsulimonadales bacterium]